MQVDKACHAKFYFCFRSPYAWIAAGLLEKQRHLIPDIDVEFRPFWEPDSTSLAMLEAQGGEWLYTPMHRTKHFYILQDIKRLVSHLGYSVKWPIDKDPWWEPSHLGYIAAKQLGKGDQFFKAVYRARWEQGKDICNPSVLEDISAEIGLRPDMITNACEDKGIRERGIKALYQCYRDGVFGIPFFIHGNQKFWGIDRFPWFIRHLQSIGSGNTEKGIRYDEGISPFCSLANFYDNDHAGGCG